MHACVYVCDLEEKPAFFETRETPDTGADQDTVRVYCGPRLLELVKRHRGGYVTICYTLIVAINQVAI